MALSGGVCGPLQHEIRWQSWSIVLNLMRQQLKYGIIEHGSSASPGFQSSGGLQTNMS
jgi:hypothetical protein